MDVTPTTQARKMLQKTNLIHVIVAAIVTKMRIHPVTVIVTVAKIANVMRNAIVHVTAKNVLVK